ncbi:Tab2/Atab2 family RNA-binding protein [Prochlorococcus sp. MIT 1341]|uniref:Tab2/Atab2 family RNA-binding protein n=1 Tax=Prochlorococcus sp. MIT 1341 TaxID=3096221 RepID=UPI002A763F8C|nr:Tab2/Atab2 family RNA-binding protein [Prochlorococcus sp. MIT 1341]
MSTLKQADWELDFYSRPIIESDGKKRWELLIISSPDLSNSKPFKWEKRCPANEVNSLWLGQALKEALEEANKQGWEAPLRLRCWRTSMKSMVKRAAEELGLEIISSRRTYALVEWLSEREKNLYPNEDGYMAGPLAPPPVPILNQPIPLPEAVRGDAWSWASIPMGILQEAKEWPMEFNGLLPMGDVLNAELPIPGLRLFSKSRSLALAAWLGGLEPVRLVVERTQLLLEAGQDDRWLVTDLDQQTAIMAEKDLKNTRENGTGLQFIAVQSNPKKEFFDGFWMLRDVI